MFDKYINIIEKVILFEGIPRKELPFMLNCLNCELRTYGKGEFILMAGDPPKHVGIVLSGQAQVTKTDMQGNRAILTTIPPGEIFAEAICCAKIEHSPVTVEASEGCDVMLIDFFRILHSHPESSGFNGKLIENMLLVMARKNIFLQGRIDIMRNKSIREKVMMYLSSAGASPGSSTTIPLNREQMAEYLCVDRSALSHELIRMKKEGIIDYHKNNFIIF